MNAVIKRLLIARAEKLEGFVLDIGAGREGTMAKACRKEIMGVDTSKTEIKEAKSRDAIANWVLRDACYMPLRSDTFDVATFFFSIMYIKTPEEEYAAMVEAKRALKPDELLYLWDAIIREKPDLYVVFAEANLPDGERIYAGYGVKGKGEKEQTPELIKLALEAGLARAHQAGSASNRSVNLAIPSSRPIRLISSPSSRLLS